MIKIVFMGSPEFALQSFQAVADNFKVVGVVTQPDRRAGRGRKMVSPPVKILADSLGIPVIQPHRLRDPDAFSQLQSWAPDCIVVAAYGQILRPNVLDLPRFGSINVHASLLPRWRGASPINHSILFGDDETGITIMRMDPGLDTGPILSQRPLKIDPLETAESLGPKLARLGAKLLVETLPAYFAGDLNPTPQEDSSATYAPMLKKSDGRLDFTKPAESLERQIRAFIPWPGSFMERDGGLLKILEAATASCAKPEPGKTFVFENFPAVETSEGAVVLKTVQPPGKKPMAGDAFLRGAGVW